MNSCETWLLEYLMNSVWQLPLLLLAGFIAARILRACGPAVEHRIWVTVLVLQATLPTCRFDPLPWLGILLSGLKQQTANQAGRVTIQIGPGLALDSSALAPWLLGTLSWAYASTILFFAARFLWGIAPNVSPPSFRNISRASRKGSRVR